MAGDDLGIVHIQATELCTYAGHKLVGSAVGAVAAYAVFLIILVRQAVHVCVGRHGLVESGIKRNHLRNCGKGFLHSPDTKEMGRVVEGGEICTEGDLVDDGIIHQYGTGEEITTLHDAVAHSFNVFKGLENTGLGICEGGQDELHTHLVVRNGNVRHNFFFTGGSVLQDTGGKADFLCNTLCDDVKHIVALHVQKLVLYGRAAAVDNKDNHRLLWFS